MLTKVFSVFEESDLSVQHGSVVADERSKLVTQ